MAFTPTEEQEDIAKEFDTNSDITVLAFAGTGKSSTLGMLGERHFDRRGAYTAFNKSAVDDFKSHAPANVVCKTGHGFAWKPIIKYQNSPYGKRLAESARMPARVLAQNLHIDKAFKIKDDVFLEPTHIALMARDTVKNYCNSSERQLHESFIPYQEGVEGNVLHELRHIVFNKALEIWADAQNPTGRLKFEHDYYVKLWALSNPDMSDEFDFILYDEAQDANPVMADVIMHQKMQKIFVGDSYQAIYGWRGAIDAMESFPGIKKYLSQSFRFGSEVAGVANKFLKLLDSEKLVKGLDSISDNVDYLPEPDAILCRTNGCGIQNVIQYQQQGKKMAFVGGGGDIKSFMYHAMALMKGEKPRFPYPPLVAFADWAEVVDYIENDSGGSDLKVMAKLARDFGPVACIQAIDALVPEEEADIIVSTVHKAKGREWNKVKIAEDFSSIFRTDEDSGKIVPPTRNELMLSYVAVTRAKEVLDIGGLSMIDSVEKVEVK